MWACIISDEGELWNVLGRFGCRKLWVLVNICPSAAEFSVDGPPVGVFVAMGISRPL